MKDIKLTEKDKTELEAIEREHILAALEHYEWDTIKTAKALEMSLKDLISKLQDYGLCYEYP